MLYGSRLTSAHLGTIANICIVCADDTYELAAVADSDLEKEELVQKMTEKVNEIGKTAGEQGSEQWLKERRNRLTASNFGSVCHLRKTTSPKSTVQNLLYSNFKGNAATAYGLPQESESERQLVAWLVSRGASEVSVSHPGLVPLPSHNVLGASPDGIVVCQPNQSNMPSHFIVEY